MLFMALAVIAKKSVKLKIIWKKLNKLYSTPYYGILLAVTTVIFY